MNALRSRARILEEMGILPKWMLRSNSIEFEKKEDTSIQIASPKEPSLSPNIQEHSKKNNVPKPTIKTAPTGQQVSFPTKVFDSWEHLTSCIQNCSLCDLHKTRTQTVVGVGDIRAEWLFVGEGPGFYEDQQGEPFVGRSGILLDNMLASMNMKRGENVYIANIVKCRAMDRSKKDRPPTEVESQQCLPYLMWQIKTIAPKIIVALGKTAAMNLLKVDPSVTMAALRGKVHHIQVENQTIPVIVTYHPSYLLRTGIAKRQAWEDIGLAHVTCN